MIERTCAGRQRMEERMHGRREPYDHTQAFCVAEAIANIRE